MKLQIDTKEKTVSILENANIRELTKALEGMLGADYENYTIKSDIVVYTYYYPWYQWYYTPQPWFPTTNPYYICTSTGEKFTELPSTTAVYNVDVQSCN